MGDRSKNLKDNATTILQTSVRKVLKRRTITSQLFPDIDQSLVENNFTQPEKSTKYWSTSATGAISKLTSRMPPVREKKEKKRERWLLTRKTWKYMADAGRKLIPDGVQNRPEDIPKCERHFHNLCASEPKFILWRRKASYPGAMVTSRHSKRRLKLMLSRNQKSFGFPDEESKNADQIIDMLQTYLKLDESRKTTTLLGSKTVRPDQTMSPSAQRPMSTSSGTIASLSSRGPGFLPSLAQSQKLADTVTQIQQLLERLRIYSQNASSRTIIPLDKITPEILEDKALLKQIYNELKKQQLHRILGKHSSLPPLSNLPHSSSLSSLWHFKRDSTAGTTTTTTTAAGDSSGTTTTCSSNTVLHHALREQKKKELKLNLAIGGGSGIGTSSFGVDTNLEGASDNFGVLVRSGMCKDSEITSTSSTTATIHQRRKKQPPIAIATRSETLSPSSHPIPVISIKKPSVEKTYNSLGTQTTFVGYNELQRLSKDYQERKRDEQILASSPGATGATDDESDSKGTQSPSNAHSRRKSSIDNEDVSQSVSDTIKRYLRMARKKSVHDDAANRFKRVNYDRNLRNIRAKGEINPPGMDEDNSKATQTLDAWALISLEFIRGNENSLLLDEAHNDWLKSLQQRIQQKQEYEDKLKQEDVHNQHQQQSPKQHSNFSAPTSPTSGQQTLSQSLQHSASQSSGIIHSSTQFLSNLWHGTGHGHQNENSAHNSTTNSTCSINSTMTTSSVPSSSQSKNQKNTAAMQKSKSSSNVGQFVSKKIWKSRSKSQTRSVAKPEWTPQGSCIWTSSNGRRLVLSDTRLQDLTEVERKALHRVSIDKINQLNIGVNVTVPSENSTTVPSSKPQKRRQLLIKRKALTTSFFDTGNSKEDKEKNNNSGRGRVFGISLEKCVDNDQRTQTVSELNATADSNYESGSRNSIISLLGGSSRGNDNIGSCESLPTHSVINQRNSPASNSNLGNLSSMKISLSQSDIRRNSQDEFDLQSNVTTIAPPMTETNSNIGKQVPALVTACINHLESEGLRCKGIFRVSTSLKRVRELKEDFDRGEISTIAKNVSAHDVATLLKQYFRDLPEPLLCRSLYQAFVKTQKIRNRRLQLEAISYLVKLLPVAHRDTLYALLSFLAKVALNCDDRREDDGQITIGNKMDSYNLATVFAPNILRASLPGQEPTEQEMLEQNDGIYVIRTMIDHYEQLFRVPADLLDEIYSTMIDTFPEQLNYLCDKRDIMAENYELDSASSSTPLSSPPASSSNESSYRQKVFNDYLEKQTTTVASTGSSTPRRMFTREDVMHENAATAIVDEYNPESGSRGRERSSKMKYIESDHDMIRRRRRFLANEATSNVYQQQNQQQQHPQPQQQSQTHQYQHPKAEFHSTSEQYQPQGARPKMSSVAATKTTSTGATNENSLTRRLSSPYILDKVGVVSASLQIPIQMQQQAAASNTFFDESINPKNRSSGELDLSDIPFIEDASYGQEIECNWDEGSPITGSLMFSSSKPNMSRKNSTDSFQIPISFEGRILNTSLSVLGMTSDSKQSSFQTPIKEQNTSTQNQRSSATSSSSSPLTRKHSGFGLGVMSLETTPSFEPKLTTSITNIGGAVLRSKTADFERMSHTRNTNNRNMDFDDDSANITSTTIASARRSSSTSVVTGSEVGNTDSPHENQMSRFRRPSQGPIYKRQQLISSAKRTTSKK